MTSAFSLKSFRETYRTEITPVSVNGRQFHLHVPASLDDFIDPDNPVRDFPLWAKVWEASLVLADFMARQPPDPQRCILEIGAGLGLIGVVSAAFGHRTTATEYNADALAFARANAAINDGADLAVEKLDWHAPRLGGTFDRIVGSEVVYREADFQALRDLFDRYLKPGGDIILASGMRKTDMVFFDRMQRQYTIKVQKKTLRSAQEATDVLLCKMTRR